jgi:hypothetical protein
VRGNPGNGLLPVEVIPILDPGALFPRNDLATDFTFLHEQGPHTGPGFLVLVDPFGDDMTRPS